MRPVVANTVTLHESISLNVNFDKLAVFHGFGTFEAERPETYIYTSLKL